ncbi:MAG: PKD domain-containing protein, partial [Bacteroidota bacterium]
MKRFSHLLLPMMLLLFACGRQELPEVRKGEPSFFLTGKIGEETLDLAAGLENYYMHTDFGSTEDSILAFEASLSLADCRDCPGSLRIFMRDAEVRNQGASVPIDEVILPGDYAFTNPKPEGPFFYRVEFNNDEIAGDDVVYQWDFGDGFAAKGINPVHEYLRQSLINPRVCLTAIDESGCKSTICNDLNLISEGCKADFQFAVNDNNYVSFQNQSVGIAPFDYEWDLGDGFNATLGNPGYQYESDNLFRVCLEISDAVGCESKICKNLSTGFGDCVSNFNYEVSRQASPDPSQPQSVLIVWTSPNGTVYRSDGGPQDAEQLFRIQEVEPCTSQAVRATVTASTTAAS